MSPTKKARTARRATGPRVHADLTLRSRSGASIHARSGRLDARPLADYLPPPDAAEEAAAHLKSLGLQVTAHGQASLCIAAPRDVFEATFGVQLTMKRYAPERAFDEGSPKAGEAAATCFLLAGGLELPVPASLRGWVEKAHLAAPVRLCQSATPPTPAYFHLKPPGVARQVDAIQCHQRGITGAGTRLAMADFGTFAHPYFVAQGYDIEVDDSLLDGGSGGNSSHGTAIAANALAVAPGVKFIGIRMGGVLTALAAVIKALEHAPDVLSISWGIQEPYASLVAPLFELELWAAIEVAGVTVCCAGGNGGWIPALATDPRVIAVGGAYCDAHDALTASSYASSGTVDGRAVPDLSGLVGHAPHGIYITLPCEPGSAEDVAFAGGTFPTGDETGPADGWVVASGTSSATPQVAAAACLLVHSDTLAWRRQPAKIKERLVGTAVDVTSAAVASANGDVPAPGTDAATGSGLMDAFVAINQVDIWLRDRPDERGLVPSRSAFWESPDIKVVTSPLADPQAEYDGARHVTRVRSGRPVYVYATVRNRGVVAAEQVDVRLAYAPPCTLPMAQWLQGSSASDGISVDGVPGNRIGLPALAPGAATVVGPWVWNPPPASERNTVLGAHGEPAGQHLSLLVRADCARDASPFPASGRGLLTVAQSNNFAVRQAWVVDRGTSFPLSLGFGASVQPMRFLLDTSALPASATLKAQVPRSELDARMLQALDPWVAASDARSVTLKFACGGRHEIVLTASGRVPVRWSLGARAGAVARTVPLHLMQLARNGDAVGGATVWLNLGP